MKVVLFFFNNHGRGPESMRHILYGRYARVGFLFVSDCMMEGFWTSAGQKYGRRFLTCKKDRFCEEGDTDFLLLPVNDEEAHRLWGTCDACVQAGKPFNLVDLLLMHVPFRDVEDLSVIDSPTLNNTQAVILILRECLRIDNQLRNGIEGLNSRQTLTENLYDRLRPYTVPVFWSSLTSLVKWPADVELMDTQ
jgi:hypothetical protein